jgi:hypothetical protein
MPISNGDGHLKENPGSSNFGHCQRYKSCLTFAKKRNLPALTFLALIVNIWSYILITVAIVLQAISYNLTQ